LTNSVDYDTDYTDMNDCTMDALAKAPNVSRKVVAPLPELRLGPRVEGHHVRGERDLGTVEYSETFREGKIPALLGAQRGRALPELGRARRSSSHPLAVEA
jgi:hypothetical protein